MHRRLIELEYFRVLLKYLGDMACPQSRFGSRHPRIASFRQDSEALVPVRFGSRQAHSFLHFAMDLRTKSAAPLNPFIRCRKSDKMTSVSSALKCVVSLVVVFGILYVLISPLPEVDATFSGKSALSYFILITHSLLGLLVLTFLVRFRPLEWIAFAHGNVLNMICVRLC